jgi:DNA processing protein
LTLPPPSLLAPGAPGYPRLLGMIPSPPDPLFVSGALVPGDALAVAIVGTRTPTPYGLAVAERLGRELAEQGVTVVSGLARGVDTAAHLGALAGKGRTVAVLGCGLDVDYPPGSRPLKGRIAAAGAVVSEFPHDTSPQTWTFPRRNRLISGLALGVVVVEAGEKSGALITAGLAADQGREVMAVPGRVDSAMTRGTFALLRQGATPVSCAREVMEAVGAASLFPSRPRRPSPPEPEHGGPGGGGPAGTSPLLALLRRCPSRAEEIAAHCGIALPLVLGQLSHLELQGLVRKETGGYYSLPDFTGRED